MPQMSNLSWFNLAFLMVFFFFIFFLLLYYSYSFSLKKSFYKNLSNFNFSFFI